MKRIKQLLATGAVALTLSGVALAEKLAGPVTAGDTNDWAYLDNGQLRLGVKKTSGAAIAWLSRSGSTRNLLNHYDHGRLIQQSYYGDSDGSTWAGQTWRWNPVQGGDWQGHAAKVLEVKATATTLESKTMPKHWATGADVPEMTMEQRIELEGNVARVRFTMRYTGQHAHAPADHELPAFFAEPDLSMLVLYDGDKPWTGAPVSRSKPGWPNESRRMTENWAAYVDDKDFGVGAYVPVTTRLTCYRYEAVPSSCSYFAPLKKFAITPGVVVEYAVWLTIGTSGEIRETFRRLQGP
jgi:hypothetical protein